MPISIEEYKNPRFVKHRTRYTLVTDKTARYYDFSTDIRGYRGAFKQAGYNPNHNSTSVERININSESISLRPY